MTRFRLSVHDISCASAVIHIQKGKNGRLDLKQCACKERARTPPRIGGTVSARMARQSIILTLAAARKIVEI